MLGMMVVSHGSLAKEFVDVAFRILGEEDPAVVALCIDWNADSASAKEQIKKALKKIQDGSDGVLILTDLFGGTPTNLSLGFLDPARSEVVTGVNLPMLIKLAGARRQNTQGLRQLAKLVAEKGQKSIYVVSEILERRPGGEKGHGPAHS